MKVHPAVGSNPRIDAPMVWSMAVSVLLAIALIAGVDIGRVAAASAPQTPQTTRPPAPSEEPIQTPQTPPPPMPSEEPNRPPRTSPTPAPSQEPIHAYVEAEVLIRPEGAVEGWTWLSGWYLEAAFEGANVIWAEPVTKEDQVPATWLIEVTAESAQAALTVTPDVDFKIVRVRCLGGELGDQPIPATFDGSTVAFEITRQYDATYSCAFIVERDGVTPTPAALNVTFDPPQDRPGSKIFVPETICGFAQRGYDKIWFSDRNVPLLPEGVTGLFDALAISMLTPVGGEEAEFGITGAAATFIVPRLSHGEYYLYADCYEASACCFPLRPTFRILALPDTATETRVPPGALSLDLLALAFGFGGAVSAIRLRSRDTARRRPPL